MKTSWAAFKICAVAFLIPFAFITDQALLFVGSWSEIAVAGVGLIFSTTVWAIGVTGFAKRTMNKLERALMMGCGFVALVTPTASIYWTVGILLACIYIVYHIMSSKTLTRETFKAQAS